MSEVYLQASLSKRPHSFLLVKVLRIEFTVGCFEQESLQVEPSSGSSSVTSLPLQRVSAAAARHWGAHHQAALRPHEAEVQRVRPDTDTAELEVLDRILLHPDRLGFITRRQWVDDRERPHRPVIEKGDYRYQNMKQKVHKMEFIFVVCSFYRASLVK